MRSVSVGWPVFIWSGSSYRSFLFFVSQVVDLANDILRPTILLNEAINDGKMHICTNQNTKMDGIENEWWNDEECAHFYLASIRESWITWRDTETAPNKWLFPQLNSIIYKKFTVNFSFHRTISTTAIFYLNKFKAGKNAFMTAQYELSKRPFGVEAAKSALNSTQLKRIDSIPSECCSWFKHIILGNILRHCGIWYVCLSYTYSYIHVFVYSFELYYSVYTHILIVCMRKKN